MDSSKAINTPMSTFTKLEVDESGESFDQKTYKGMIGSLLYLTTVRIGAALRGGGELVQRIKTSILIKSFVR